MNWRVVLLLPSIVNIHMQMKLKYTEICHTSKYFLSCRIAPHQQILSKKLVSLYSVAFYLQGHVTIPPKNKKLDNFEIWCTTFQRTMRWPANVNICHQLFPLYVKYDKNLFQSDWFGRFHWKSAKDKIDIPISTNQHSDQNNLIHHHKKLYTGTEHDPFLALKTN